MIPGRPSAMIVDPVEARAAELTLAFRQIGVAPAVVTGGDPWPALIQLQPQHVFLARDSSAALTLLRRIRDEVAPQDRPRVHVFCDADQLGPELRDLLPSTVLILPVATATLTALLQVPPGAPDFGAQAARLRQLTTQTLLGSDLFGTIDQLVLNTAGIFGASDCVLWGPRSEPYWPRTARPIAHGADQDALLYRCELALDAATSTLVAVPGSGGSTVVDRPGQSFMAAPLAPPGSNELGGIGLVSDDSRPFSAEDRVALELFARRLSLELAWVSAHIRLASEHEKLRETALLDPLLGIWTRSAFEQALTGEIAAAQRRREELALAIIDVIQLRQVNERYGHMIGDKVLAHIAKCIPSALGRQDLVGRFGGDEIAVLLLGSDIASAQRTFDNLAEMIQRNPYQDGGKEIHVDVTVGLTTVADFERTGERALARALSANRRARRSHQAVVVADPELDATSGDGESSLDAEKGLPHGFTLGGMYRILHEINRGAMGVVYRADDLGLGRQVAIKVLRSDLARNLDLVARFRDEAAMLASLRHRNLVGIYAFGSEGDEVYFVMELVEGESLKDVLARIKERREKFDPSALAKIVTEIADALHAIHSVGIIHRDVKPSNILLDRIGDRAVLVDVGVAKRREERGDAAGTPGYAAPESFMDAQETSATDVYGLAATTYKSLTGRAPFGGGAVEQVVRRQLSDRPIAASIRRPELSPAVDKVLFKALHPEQSERYQDAPAFAAAFARALSQRGELPDEIPTRVVRVGTDPIHSIQLEIKPARADRHDRYESSVATLLPPPNTERPKASESVAEGTGTQGGSGSTRGAMFRVASKLLSHRLGSTWVRKLGENEPSLSEVLQPNLSPMSWQPIEHLIALLERTTGRVRDPRDLARTLGRTTMTATLARFFGADPRTMTPSALLKAAEAYWSRYHTWGRVRVVDDGPAAVVVTITDCPRDMLIAALIEGALGRIAELAGSTKVEVSHKETTFEGQHAYSFGVRWSELEPGADSELASGVGSPAPSA